MKLNFSTSVGYKKLKETIENVEQGKTNMHFARMKFFDAFSHMYRDACSDEDIAFVREWEIKVIDCYQKLLDKNYQEIKEYVVNGVPDYDKMRYWILTVDENNCPKMTKIADVVKGTPVYADNCKEVKIDNIVGYIGEYRYELRSWLEYNSNLLELKKAALNLKNREKLGVECIPEPNYNMDGMTREQRDSQAWENYVIENGMYRPIIYDNSLDGLLNNIDKCLEFYDKVKLMVEKEGEIDE